MSSIFNKYLYLFMLLYISSVGASQYDSRDEELDSVASIAAASLLGQQSRNARAHSIPSSSNGISPDVFLSSSITPSRRRERVITPSSSYQYDEKECIYESPAPREPRILPVDPRLLARDRNYSPWNYVAHGNATPRSTTPMSSEISASSSSRSITPWLVSESYNQRPVFSPSNFRATPPMRYASPTHMPISSPIPHNSPVEQPNRSGNASPFNLND